MTSPKRQAGVLLALGLMIAMTMSVLSSGSSASAEERRENYAYSYAPDNYTPVPGVRFNNPLTKKSHSIARHIKRTINSAPNGTRLRLATWNFKSKPYMDALIRAHKRGVSVRVLMAHGLFKNYGSHTPAKQLAAALAKGNANRSPSMTSWLRTCKSSCRGSGGILHSKFVVAQKAGKASRIVISTSANLTEVANNRQWNDAFTVTNRTAPYNNFLKIFNQMAGDRARKSPFYTFPAKELTGWFHPAGNHNLPMAMLNKVRCNGATNGVNGHTVIRIAQAIFNGRIGYRIARKLRELHSNGCNIKIVYTKFDSDSARALGPIRKRQILQDLDGDGFHDRYLHIKAMAIHGWYGNKRGARIAIQGSANWSGMGWLADEQGFIIRRGSAEKNYVDWVDYLYANPPRNPYPRSTARMSASVDNPFKYVEMD